MGILAVILGILAIIGAFFVTALFGTTGGIIIGVIGAIAIVLGVLKRKKDGKGGIAGIVAGVLAIIMAVSMTSVWSTGFKELHRKAVEYKPDGMWAQASEDTNGGLMGIITKVSTDQASLDQLMKEMDELNKLSAVEKKD